MMVAMIDESDLTHEYELRHIPRKNTLISGLIWINADLIKRWPFPLSPRAMLMLMLMVWYANTPDWPTTDARAVIAVAAPDTAA